MISTEPILTDWGEWLPAPIESLRMFRDECLRVHPLTLEHPGVPARALLRIRVNLITGCWEWQAGLDKDGYGRVWDEVKRENVQAHIYVYQRIKGPVPADKPMLDHLCRHHPCCWPMHLDPKTNQHNQEVGAQARKIFGRHLLIGHSAKALANSRGSSCTTLIEKAVTLA